MGTSSLWRANPSRIRCSSPLRLLIKYEVHTHTGKNSGSNPPPSMVSLTKREVKLSCDLAKFLKDEPGSIYTTLCLGSFSLRYDMSSCDWVLLPEPDLP